MRRRRRRWCPEEVTELQVPPLAETPPWTTLLSVQRHQFDHRLIWQQLCEQDLWTLTLRSFSLTRPWDSWMSLWSSWMWLDWACNSASCCCTVASWDSATCRSLLLKRASLCTWNTWTSKTSSGTLSLQQDYVHVRSSLHARCLLLISKWQ